MRAIAESVLLLTACLVFTGCESAAVKETVENCSKKAVHVHGPGISERTIYACDGRGVADELAKNCSGDVVDLCYVAPPGTEGCKWKRKSRNLADALTV